MTHRMMMGTFALAALLGCGAGATPDDVASAQEGTPAPGSYADAVPAGLRTLDAGDVDLALGARASNAFGADLHKRLATHGTNLIWSPYSVSSAMGMALAGAKGTTATEMQKAMHAPAGQATALAKALGVHQRLLDERAGGNTIRVANAIWAAPAARFVPDYVLTVGAAYGGGLHRVDFAGDGEAARGAINGWIGKQTEGLIPELIPAGVLTPTTQAVLCNALYFKGTWTHQFKTADTKPRPFHTEGGKTEQRSMMYRKGKLRYAEMDGFKVGAFPYIGDTLSMIVVLPDSNDGLRPIEERLTGARLEEWIDAALGARERDKVHIQLPKWKAKTASGLVPAMKALGMRACFSDRDADFTGMLTSDEVYISEVLHQAVIEVNEEGTEAAAATGVVMKTKSAALQSDQFFANRPFLYAIVEHDTQAVLFLGRCADPAKE